MCNKLVSVIIPIYNTDKYLDECIQSILNQTYKNIEIILVNDGSTDDSDKICKRYNEQYQNIIYISQTNKGVSVARNNGLDAATGEYVYFMDSDDKIDSKFIKTSIMTAENNDSDVVIVACNVMNKELTKYICAPWECFIKKKLLDEYQMLRFAPNLQYGEDGLFIHEILCLAKNISINKKAIYHYRKRKGQLSRAWTETETETCLTYISIILKTLEDFYCKYNLFTEKKLFLHSFLVRQPYFYYIDVNFTKQQRGKLFNLLYNFREKHDLLGIYTVRDRNITLLRKIMIKKLLHCKNYEQYEKYLIIIDIYRNLKRNIFRKKNIQFYNIMED